MVLHQLSKHIMIKKHYFITTLFTLAPVLVHAAAATPTDFKSFIELFLAVLQGFISLLFASLAVGILYGIVLYMLNADNEKKRTEIRGYLVYAIIGIAVVMGLWGILALLNDTIFGGAVGIPYISAPT